MNKFREKCKKEWDEFVARVPKERVDELIESICYRGVNEYIPEAYYLMRRMRDYDLRDIEVYETPMGQKYLRYKDYDSTQILFLDNGFICYECGILNYCGVVFKKGMRLHDKDDDYDF